MKGERTTQAPAPNQSRYAPEEWEIRVHLAAFYRLMARFGFSDLAGAHVSATIPGTEHYLLNPYGYLFDDITASNLVAVDLNGKVIGDARQDLNSAGTAIHGAVHRARPDAVAVAHCHPRAAVALSALGCELLPVDQAALAVHGDLGYSDFSFVETAEELARLVADLGGKHALILRNHGVLTVGDSLAEAWYRLYKLDVACDIQLRAMTAAAGRPLTIPSPAVCDDAARRWDTPLYARKAWEALTRRLDAEDPSYKL